MFIEHNENGLIYMASDRIPVRHAFTTRCGGVSAGEFASLNLGSNRGDDLLASCYRSCLELADENGCRTVDFPSISTGVYGFPVERAAGIAIRTIADFLAGHPAIERVRMVCFDSRTKAVYDRALREWEGRA